VNVPGYEGLEVFYGDLHSHCDVGYGQGTVEQAYANARLQLDFASVTAHGAWPDMPAAVGRLATTVTYHADGFQIAARRWPHLLDVTAAVSEEGRFVAFPSFEWHSLRYGDHHICYEDARGDIVPASSLAELRSALRQLRVRGVASYLIPHHIGYAPGQRGLDWAEFDEELSPVVEIFSLHGAAEHDDAPYPYLHTMGPRDGRSTMRAGLVRGHVFGVVGSTDHHAAFPGSYGHGRAAVWARALTRRDLWAALGARRTYALTGDRIMVALAVNGQPMGTVLPWCRHRRIDVAVVGGAPLDVVDVVHNDRVLHRWWPVRAETTPTGPYKVSVEVGWGDRDTPVDWRIDLMVVGGTLMSVEPRLRGPEVVSPRHAGSATSVTASWVRPEPHRVVLAVRTCGNPGPRVPATQGMCLEVDGDPTTRIVGRINQQPVDLRIADLLESGHSGVLAGFRSAAYRFGRAAARGEYAGAFSLVHDGVPGRRDWYYVRVRQVNDQWAWTSPVWVMPS
jgi:hypothetical protein